MIMLNGRSRTTARGALGLAACMATLAGCAGNGAGDGQEPTQVFSTRSESVLGREEPEVVVRPIAPPPLRTDPRELRANAIDILVLASTSEAPILRANGIEALQLAPAYLDESLRKGLTDTNRGVRFVSAWTVGEQRAKSMASLVEPLLNDPSESVQAAAIYAMHRCGRPVDPTPLGRMLMSSDPEVRGNAAMAIGEIGDPSALPMLDEAVGVASLRAPAARVQLVDLQIAAASVKLGDERDLEVIRAALFAPPERGAELTLLACEIVADLGDLGSVPTLKELASRTGDLQPPAEIRMAAVRALARLEPSRVLSDIPRTYIGSERFELRALAASTLGETRDESNLPIVGTMMGDQSPLVQVSAAKAVLILTD